MNHLGSTCFKLGPNFFHPFTPYWSERIPFFMRKRFICNMDLETETKLSSGINLRTICCVIPLVSREFKSQIIRLLNVHMLWILWKIRVELKELKCGPGLTTGDMTDSPPWKRVILKISTPHLSTTENILRPKEIGIMSTVIKFRSLSKRLSQTKIFAIPRFVSPQHR